VSKAISTHEFVDLVVDEEPTLAKALARIAIWESDRAIRQALEWQRTGVSTASHGGAWDTCFNHLFQLAFERWVTRRGTGTLLQDAERPVSTRIERDERKRKRRCTCAGNEATRAYALEPSAYLDPDCPEHGRAPRP
jgi:hypothetical protein